MVYQVSERRLIEGYGYIENVLRMTVEADNSNEAIGILNEYGFEVVGINEKFGNIVVSERK